jgi:hypothetical protein
LYCNLNDALRVLSMWGQSGGIADVTLDGIVGVDDMLALPSGWGPCPE